MQEQSKCSSLERVLPWASLPFLCCEQQSDKLLWQCTGTPHTTHDTSLHWDPGTARYVSIHPGHSRTSAAAALAPAPAPPSLPVSARSSHRRATRAYYYPPRFASCSPFGPAGPPAGLALPGCPFSFVLPVLCMGVSVPACCVTGPKARPTSSSSGPRSGVAPLQLRLDHPILYHRVLPTTT